MSSKHADPSAAPPRSPAARRARTRAVAGTGAALAAAALTLSAGPVQAAATSLRIPISDTVLTSAGALQFTGTLHVVAAPLDPYSPGDPHRVHTNLIQGKVTGDGLSCRISGTPKAVAPADSPFTLSYAYSGSSACTDLGSLRLQLELSADDDGRVTDVEVQALEGLD